MIVITTGSLKLNRAKKGVGISSVLWSDIQWSQVLVQQVVGEVVFTFSWLGWIVECVCPHAPPPHPPMGSRKAPEKSRLAGRLCAVFEWGK